jgi:hypothetical protein
MAQRLACVAVITSFEMMDEALVQRLRVGGARRTSVYTVNDPRGGQMTRLGSTAS